LVPEIGPLEPEQSAKPEREHQQREQALDASPAAQCGAALAVGAAEDLI
jgi:hypothetical protein